MRSFLKKLYHPVLFDVLFGAAGALGIAGALLDAGRAYPAIEAAENPPLKGATLLGAVLVAGALAVGASRFDQKNADDFVFQTLTKSAFIAFYNLIFAAALWEVLFTPSLGSIHFHTVMVMALIAWPLGWFYTRLRGTRP